MPNWFARQAQHYRATYRHPVRRNLALCFWTMLLSRMCVSILLPSLFPFVSAVGGSEPFYGAIVALFNLAQLLASPAMGAWAQRRSPKEVLLCSLAVEMVGHALYATAHAPGMLLAARILAGIGLGNESVINSYITGVTSPATRSNAFGKMQVAIAAAYALGPFTAVGLSFVNFKVGSLDVNGITSPGLVACFLSILNFLLVLLFVDHPDVDLLVDDLSGDIITPRTPVMSRKHKIESNHPRSSSIGDSNMKRTASGAMLVDESNIGVAALQSPTLVKVGTNQLLDDEPVLGDSGEVNVPLLPTATTGIGSTPVSSLRSTIRFLTTAEFRDALPATLPLVASSFFLTSTSAVFEFVATPLTIDEYDFDVTENSVLWTCVGSISATALLILGCQQKHNQRDFSYLLGSSTALVLALSLMFSFKASQLQLWRFLVGTGFVAIAYPFSITFLTSVFSQIVEEQSEPGAMMGLLLAGGAAAKLVSPLYASELDFAVVFIVLLCICVVNLVMLALLRRNVTSRL